MAEPSNTFGCDTLAETTLNAIFVKQSRSTITSALNIL